jgi:hypothetical protein
MNWPLNGNLHIPDLLEFTSKDLDLITAKLYHAGPRESMGKVGPEDIDDYFLSIKARRS